MFVLPYEIVKEQKNFAVGNPPRFVAENRLAIYHPWVRFSVPKNYGPERARPRHSTGRPVA